jgi:hypothetical protein
MQRTMSTPRPKYRRWRGEEKKRHWVYTAYGICIDFPYICFFFFVRLAGPSHSLPSLLFAIVIYR